MSDNKHPVRNSVIGTVLAAAILGLARYLFGSWDKVFAVLGNSFTSILKFVTNPVSVPLWVIIIVCVLTVGAAICIVLWLAALGQAAPRFDYRAFRESDFLGIKWRWGYSDSGTINNIIPYCPKCDLAMRPTSVSSYRAISGIKYFCDNRDFESQEFPFHETELYDRIVREIDKEIRSRESSARKRPEG